MCCSFFGLLSFMCCHLWALYCYRLMHMRVLIKTYYFALFLWMLLLWLMFGWVFFEIQMILSKQLLQMILISLPNYTVNCDTQLNDILWTWAFINLEAFTSVILFIYRDAQKMKPQPISLFLPSQRDIHSHLDEKNSSRFLQHVTETWGHKILLLSEWQVWGWLDLFLNVGGCVLLD